MWPVRSATRPRGYLDWLVTVAIIPALAFGTNACSSDSAEPASTVITDKATPYADLLVPKLQASVKDGAVGVAVDQPVTVTAGNGVLGAVSLVRPDGSPVQGKLSADGLTCSTTEQLVYNKQYTLNAEALGLSGITRQHMTFRTHSPDNLTSAYVLPSDGEVVGIGQPIAIRFDENIPDRLAAQKSIKITTSPPVDGAFYWLNNREVRWRPQNFWKPGTQVDVNVAIHGVDQRRLSRRRALQAHHHGLVDLRCSGQLAQRVSHRRRMGDADLLQRNLRAFGAVVRRRTGQYEHQPWLFERESEQCGLVLQQHKTRRRRRSHQHSRGDLARHRRTRRLEHPLGTVEGGQRQRQRFGLTATQVCAAVQPR